MQNGTGKDEAPDSVVLWVHNINGGVCVKRTAKCPWAGHWGDVEKGNWEWLALM